MAILNVNELYRFYHSGDSEVAALRGVSLCVDKGEMVALLGPSGSGKSTLLNLISGLDEPDGGHVDVAGQRLSRRLESVRAAIRARHIGIFMQSGNLVDHLSVADNIRLQRMLAGKRGIDVTMTSLAGHLGLSALWQAMPGQLSGGEAARAGLAVAMAANPSVLLCDEPTAEVDGATERAIIGDLADRRAAGAAILIVTHSPSLAKAADRVLRMRDGRLLND